MKTHIEVLCAYESATGLFPEPDESSLRNHNLAEVSISQQQIYAIGRDKRQLHPQPIFMMYFP
jgi:hypothetical protein